MTGGNMLVGHDEDESDDDDDYDYEEDEDDVEHDDGDVAGVCLRRLRSTLWRRSQFCSALISRPFIIA